jgi:hypothetical protein
MDKKEELFNLVFRQMLDYADNTFVKRLADRGIQVYDLLEKYGRVTASPYEDVEYDLFIYAVALARIFGLFGMRAFNDHLSDEIEFSGQLPKTKLRSIWEPVYQRIDEIYHSLIEIYKKQGEENPDYKILLVMKEAFGDRQPLKELQAYEFIKNVFNY